MSARRLVVAVSSVVALAGCADDGPGVTRELNITEFADGFDGPTQIALAPDGRLLVAELNGGERDGTGRILAMSLDDPSEREVLIEGLVTPTGVVADGDLLWVMEQRRLTVGPVDEPSQRRVVLDDLPFNGRSEGTVTALPGGGVMYDTSGRRDGDRLVDGSGTLWALSGPDGTPVPYATGFKHAYAHTIGPDERLWVTEVSDGRLDGEQPPDELVAVEIDDEFGYPRCIGDRTPVAELGADAADCAATPRSHALFAAGATPTSVVVAPWDRSTLLVALWNHGEIVSAPTDTAGSPHPGSPVVTELDRPQHLLVVGDRVLASDHDAGRIVWLSAS